MDQWTRLIHPEIDNNDPYQANSLPIYQTATFAQDDAEDPTNQYDYSRSGNPTRAYVEAYIAKLENAQYGLAFSSGMAAISCVLQLLNAGDHIIIGTDIYGGTHRILHKVLTRFNIQCSQVDFNDEQALTQSLTANTKLVLLETPTNPLQQITDINALRSKLAQDIILAVDNTLLSPWLQKPLELGADIVIHSATKHLAGHSDVSAGVVVTNHEHLAQELKFLQNANGNALDPMQAWLLLRGVKTLGLRIERQQQSALKIAQFLENHPKVTKVYYAGLPTHPNHNIMQAQASGSGSVLSFTTESFELSKHIVNQTQLFTISVSFGSLMSLISLPCQMSHAAIDTSKRNIPESLIRLSIGIEDPDDLIDDLDKILNHEITTSLTSEHHAK
ncbi:trans-sulfuration enzyme family protein [Cysteiniphilum marinum]|uniref:trans-sulfuration enzyme family protein n=1 Tax=Cysteiniphilum marinum TaxID=2774191 RepID=UPI001939AD50|nr:PLP-dependent transferase [Cysteiniphilum marinum]